VVIGTQLFVDFLTHQLPKLSTGEAFPWLDEPDSLPINYGIYALVMNLRSLGVTFVTHGVSSAAASASVAYCWRIASLFSERMS
jgi:hypothetical protein